MKYISSLNQKIYNDKEGKNQASICDMDKEYDKDGNFKFKIINKHD
jgi:hypothetical protein